LSKIFTFVVVCLLLYGQAFAVNAITHVALSDSCTGGGARAETAKVADSSTRDFNSLFLSGGFYRDELDIAVRATGGTCYLVVDNQYTPGQDVDVWLSSDGEGGRDGGDVEKYVWALPESLAISAGSATTLTENFVYLTYNGGSPALKRHATEDQLGSRGDFLDSMILIANVGLGAVSGADEEVRYFNADQPSLYKIILTSTFHGDHPTYHVGIAPTIESKSFAATRGFLHSGPDECLIPAVNTDDVFLYVPVYNDSNYARWDSLDNFAEYSSGEAIGVPHYFWVVIWGAISKDTTQYKLYMNIQAGTNTYLTRESAEQDKYNMLPTDIPEAFHTTGFLIAGVIIQNDEVQALEDGSTYLDLRGFVSGTRGGGGAPPTDSAQIDAWNFGYQYNWLDSANVNAGWGLETTDVGDDSLHIDSTDIPMWGLWTEAYDSVNAWNNLLNDNRDSVLAFSPLVNEAKDSLTSWANEVNEHEDSVTAWANLINDNRDSATTHSPLVNEAKDSLTSWADEVNTNTDSVAAWANQVNDNSDDIDKLETEPRYLFTIWNPNSFWVADSILIGIDPRTPVAITVTRIDVTCDADPTTELDFDLMWADARIGNANRTVIDEMNTTSGTTEITSGFDDATIAVNKCIYIRFNAEPDADITDVGVRVTYTID